MFGKKGKKQIRKPRRTFQCETLETRAMMSASPLNPTAPASAVDASGATPLSAMVNTIFSAAPIGTIGGSNSLANSPANQAATTLNPTWFTPANINAAYGYNNLGLTGSGQTVAIVEAYDVFEEFSSDGGYIGTLQDDLSKFDQQFNLNNDIKLNSTLGTTVPWKGNESP